MLAGCGTLLADPGTPQASLEMEPLAESGAAEAATAEVPTREEDVVRDMIRLDRVASSGELSTSQGDYVSGPDGAYYQLRRDRFVERTLTTYRFYFRRTDGTANGSRTRFEDLPEPDRHAVSAALPIDEDSASREADDGFEFQAEVDQTYDDPQRENSALVGSEYTIVVYEGTPYRYSVEEVSSGTIRGGLVLRRVAEDRQEFLSMLVDDHGFELVLTSEEQRHIVETAIQSRYEIAFDDASRGEKDAYRAVEEQLGRNLQFRELPETRAYNERYWIVEYDGGDYLTRARRYAAE